MIKSFITLGPGFIIFLTMVKVLWSALNRCNKHNKQTRFSGQNIVDRECSGSAVECLTRDRGAEGSSLTGVSALCP